MRRALERSLAFALGIMMLNASAISAADGAPNGLVAQTPVLAPTAVPPNTPSVTSSATAPANARQIAAASPAFLPTAPSSATTTVVHGVAMTPAAIDIADQLGIMPVLERLHQLSTSGTKDADSRLERLELKQKLTDTVLIGSLQVRDVTARIDRELARLDTVHDFLQNRRDRAVRYNTYTNIFGSGILNEIGQCGEFAKNEVPGEAMQVVANAVTMLLSGVALGQNYGGKQRIIKRPNMLSKLFGTGTDVDSEYPNVIWGYMNRPQPGVQPPETRLQALLTYWRKNGNIPDIRTAAGKRQIAQLTNTHPQGAVTMSMIEARQKLLQDLHAEVLQIDRELLDLLTAVQVL